MQPVIPSRRQILQLYRKYLSTSQSFSSYNFRTYFLRRSRDMFRSALLPQAQTAHSSLSTRLSSESSATTETLTDKEKLSHFYQNAVEELKVLQRAALMNRIYEGEKLVVEKPRLIVSAGSAQPNPGPTSSDVAPSSS